MGKNMAMIRINWIVRRVVALILVVAVYGCGPQTPEEYLRQAQDHLAQQDRASAEIMLKNALQQDPAHPRARFLLGKVQLERGDALSAVAHLERAQKLAYADPEVTATLIDALIQTGRSEEAMALIRSSLQEAPTAYLQVLAGDANMALGEPEAASIAYEEATKMDPDSSSALAGLATATWARGDMDAAGSLYQRAVEAEPDNARAWMVKGAFDYAIGDYGSAEEDYSRALELAGGDSVPARLGLARTLLSVGHLDEAQEHVLAAKTASPKSPAANYFDGLVKLKRDDVKGAAEAFQQVLSNDHGHGMANLMMGEVKTREGQNVQAQQHLSLAVTKLPGTLLPRKMLARAQLRAGRPGDVIYTLEPFSRQGHNDAEFLSLLGTAYMLDGQGELATQTLGRAASIAPNAMSIKGQLALNEIKMGRYEDAQGHLEALTKARPDLVQPEILRIYAHLEQKEFAEALVIALELRDEQPNQPLMHNLVGSVYMAMDDRTKARASFQQALSIRSDFLPALLNWASLEEVEGRYSTAVDIYARVLQADPDNYRALMATAQWQSDQGRRDEAIELLERGRLAHPNSAELRLILASQYLLVGADDKALPVAKEAWKINPKGATVRLILSQAQLAAGLGDAALKNLRELSGEHPGNKEIAYQLARAQVASGDIEGAQATLEQILKSTKRNHPNSLAMLARLSLEDGDTKEARALARELQALVPERMDARVMLGDVEMAAGNFGAAEKVYDELLDSQPTPKVALKLFQSIGRAGEVSRALQFGASWLEDHPTDVILHLNMANALIADKQVDRAMQHYERILDVQPENVLALNNLAYLYSERSDPRGLELAGRAKSVAPDNPVVLDTLGWILVNDGEVTKGLGELRRALEFSPEDPDIRYRYAYGLAEAGKKSLAIKELKRALVTLNFSSRQDAELLIRKLQSN